MARIGGFLKTQNRIRRHQAQGQFISPYQTGGTIFGKFTMARYPLLYTSSRLSPPPPPPPPPGVPPLPLIPPPPPLEDGKWDHLWQV